MILQYRPIYTLVPRDVHKVCTPLCGSILFPSSVGSPLGETRQHYQSLWLLNQETVTQEKCPIPQNRRQQRIKPGPPARASGANLADRGSFSHKPARGYSSESFIKPHHFLAPPPPPPPQAVHLSEGSGRPKAAAPYPLPLLAPCGANTSQNRGILATLEKSGALDSFAALTWFVMGFVLHSSHRCVLLLQTKRLARKSSKAVNVHGDELKILVTWQVLSDRLSTGCYTALRPRCLRCSSRRQSLRPYAPLIPMDDSVWER